MFLRNVKRPKDQVGRDIEAALNRVILKNGCTVGFVLPAIQHAKGQHSPLQKSPVQGEDQSNSSPAGRQREQVSRGNPMDLNFL